MTRQTESAWDTLMLATKEQLAISELKELKVKGVESSLSSLKFSKGGDCIVGGVARRQVDLCRNGFSLAAGATDHRAPVGVPETEKISVIFPSFTSQSPTNALFLLAPVGTCSNQSLYRTQWNQEKVGKVSDINEANNLHIIPSHCY